MNVFILVKSACHFNKTCTTVMYSRSKIIYYQEDVILRGVPLLFACSLQQMYPYTSGLQKKSEVMFY